MRVALIAVLAAGTFVLAAAADAFASAEGATPQAVAANAEFLANLPAPPGGAAAVCVIDSGVDTDTDLPLSRLTRSAYDNGTPGDTGALSDTGTPMPKHGTYVAGVIASQIDGVGTNGIWPAAGIVSRRVFSGSSSVTTAQRYIRAIEWCVNESGANVKVINLSIAGLTATLQERQSLENKINGVRSPPHFVNVVAAAGNSSWTSAVSYPALAEGVFAIGATDRSGALAAWSNRGPGLDLSTLGVDSCLTAGSDSRLATGEGTSYAAPVVSGVLAALRSYRPDLGPDEAEQLLLESAEGPPTALRLNAEAAFRLGGLDELVDGNELAPSPCAVPTSAGGGASPTATPEAPALPAAAPPVVVEPADEGVFVASPALPEVIAVPALRSARFHRGVLSLRVSRLSPGDMAVFSVQGRHYVRSTPMLRLRLRRCMTVRVRIRRPSGRTSRALVVPCDVERGDRMFKTRILLSDS